MVKVNRESEMLCLDEEDEDIVLGMLILVFFLVGVMLRFIWII